MDDETPTRAGTSVYNSSVWGDQFLDPNQVTHVTYNLMMPNASLSDTYQLRTTFRLNNPQDRRPALPFHINIFNPQSEKTIQVNLQFFNTKNLDGTINIFDPIRTHQIPYQVSAQIIDSLNPYNLVKRQWVIDPSQDPQANNHLQNQRPNNQLQTNPVYYIHPNAPAIPIALRNRSISQPQFIEYQPQPILSQQAQQAHQNRIR